MDFEQYKAKMKDDDTWAPGKEEIDKCIKKLYGVQVPEFYAPIMTAGIGGDEYISFYSVYESNNQIAHKHLITYGMSNIYADEEAFGQEYSGWGYEMTMRIADYDGSDYMWVLNLMGNMARYTNTNEDAWFKENDYVLGEGKSINKDVKSKITALLIVKDPELAEIKTIHGNLEFLQLVGITNREIKAIEENTDNIKIIIENMKKDNPLFITDLKRTKDYI